MKKNLFLVLLVLGGCVNNEIKEDAPAKTKSITVWSSDLKLNYDRLTDEVTEVKEREEEVTPEVQEIVREKELPEIERVEEKRSVPEAGDEELEVILKEDLAKKIVMDESLIKGIEESGKIYLRMRRSFL